MVDNYINLIYHIFGQPFGRASAHARLSDPSIEPILASIHCTRPLIFERILGGAPMYELYVLGELMDQPLHGYLLHYILQVSLGPVRSISWGALYPLIRRLEGMGWIQTHADENAGRGRQRKVYKITPSGQARFLELMLEPVVYNTDYPDLFHIKLSNFGHVSPQQQRTILQQYRGYVQFLHDHAHMNERKVAQECNIPEQERPHILRVLHHRNTLLRADLDWVDGEIERLSNHVSASDLSFLTDTQEE